MPFFDIDKKNRITTLKRTKCMTWLNVSNLLSAYYNFASRAKLIVHAASSATFVYEQMKFILLNKYVFTDNCTLSTHLCNTVVG